MPCLPSLPPFPPLEGHCRAPKGPNFKLKTESIKDCAADFPPMKAGAAAILLLLKKGAKSTGGYPHKPPRRKKGTAHLSPPGALSKIGPWAPGCHTTHPQGNVFCPLGASTSGKCSTQEQTKRPGQKAAARRRLPWWVFAGNFIPRRFQTILIRFYSAMSKLFSFNGSALKIFADIDC